MIVVKKLQDQSLDEDLAISRTEGIDFFVTLMDNLPHHSVTTQWKRKEGITYHKQLSSTRNINWQKSSCFEGKILVTAVLALQRTTCAGHDNVQCLN